MVCVYPLDTPAHTSGQRGYSAPAAHRRRQHHPHYQLDTGNTTVPQQRAPNT